MAKRDRIEERLEALRALRLEPGRPGAVAELRKAVRSKTGLVVAAAVEIIAEAGIDELAGELPAAFSRLLDDSIKRDPGCRAKLAIVRALIEHDRWEDDVFAAGLRFVQPEPAWGGSNDTAAPLRGLCAIGYAQLGHLDGPSAIAGVLADPERAARLGAARALGDSGRPEAVPLLRFKICIGDDEPEILGAAVGSLLSLDPDGSLDFVAERLGDRDEATAEAAALALGESRLPASLPILVAWCRDAITAERRAVAHLALALLRQPEAERFLLETVRAAAATDAESAVRALATFAHDTELGARVLAAAKENPEPSVAAAATEAFSA